MGGPIRRIGAWLADMGRVARDRGVFARRPGAGVPGVGAGAAWDAGGVTRSVRSTRASRGAGFFAVKGPAPTLVANAAESSKTDRVRSDMGHLLRACVVALPFEVHANS